MVSENSIELIGKPLEILKFGLFRQFRVRKYSVDTELHDLPLQRGKNALVCHNKSGILKERL